MLKIPRRVFSFTDWAKQRPREPIPGDRIDLQFQELIDAIAATQRAISDIRADDGKLKRGIVSDDNLALRIRDKAVADIRNELEPIRSSVRSVFTSTVASEHQAELYARDAEAAAAVAAQLTSGIDAIRQQVVSAADAAARDASITGTDATDAENWGNYALAQADNAELAANLSLQWAEYLAGPVVDSAHAPAYIAGSPFPYGLYYQPVEGGVAGLWSAKWWALWAQQLVGKGAFYYLGGSATPPTPGGKNPSTGQPYPNPIAPGSLYYNTVSNTLYVWNGQDWVLQQQLTAGVTGTYLYYATAGQVAFSGPDANGQTPHVGVSPSIVHVNGDRLTSAQFTVNSTTSTLTLAAAPAAGSPVIWDLLLPQSSIAPGTVNIFKVIAFSPDGTITDFPIKYIDPTSGLATNAVVTSNAELVVVLDGVEQEPGSDYTTSTSGGASTLHMAVPPAADSDFWAEFYQPGGQAVPVPGPGVPAGGGPGQALVKNSAADYDTVWVTPANPAAGVPAGGSTGQVLLKNSAANYDTKWGASSSGGPVNVNSLISTPLVGDGVTDNTPSIKQLQQVLTSIGTEFPVAVTISNGNPAVVTLVAYSAASSKVHWWKPNQRFTFSVSAGGTLPAGITAGTPYFIMAAGMTSTSFQFSATNNYDPVIIGAGPSLVEGPPVATTSAGSGTFYVNLTGRQWIDLLWPQGAYAGTTSTPVSNSNGISRIRHFCYGAVFDGHIGYFGATATSGVAATWYPLYTGDLINTTQTFNNSAPACVVQLRTVANAANYYVGQWVAIQACNIMDWLGLVVSGPPSNHYMEYNKISAINTSTGQITLTWPLKWIYLSTLPNLFTYQYGGGAAQISPMHPAWDMDVEVHGATYADSMEFWCRDIKFIDCVVQGYKSLPGNIGPSQSRSVIYKNCRFGPGPYAGGQIDKMLEYVEFENCIGGGLQIASTSCIELVIKNCREDPRNTSLLSGTPRRISITNSILDNIRVGNTDYGQTDYAYLNNNNITWFVYAPRDDDANFWNSQNDTTLVPTWSFNATTGTFTRNFTSVQQPLMWGVPGAKIFFTDAAAAHENLGFPFEILNLYMDASGNISFDTTLKAMPPPSPSSAVTISIGAPGVVTWNAHGLAANTIVVFLPNPPGGSKNPTFATAGALLTATATSITPALPGSRVNGNLLISWCRVANGTATLSLSTAGWTVFSNVASGGSTVAIAYAYVTGTEVAPVWTASASSNLQSWTMQYANTASSSPIGAIQNVGGTTGGGITVGPLTTTSPFSIVASMIMSDQTAAFPSPPAVSSSNRLTSRATDSSVGGALWSDRAYPGSPASTGSMLSYAAAGTYSSALFEILSAATMPGGLSPSTRYYVVNPATNTFNVATAANGAAITTTGTTTGTINCYANPLHFRPHPCARFTGISNSGSPNLIDLNGSIDEPMWSRARRGFGGKQYNAYAGIYGPNPRVWGYLDATRGMVVNVRRAASAGTLLITASGWNQTTWAVSLFSQTIDLTQTGRRVVTPTAVTGNVGADALAVFADWLTGGTPTAGSSVTNGINFSFSAVPATERPVIEFEIFTDQGIHKFPVIQGAPAYPASGTYAWMWADSAIIAQYGTTP